MFKEVNLDSSPEIEVFYMLFERCCSKNVKGSIKQYTEYFDFRCKIHFDHPVNFS